MTFLLFIFVGMFGFIQFCGFLRGEIVVRLHLHLTLKQRHCIQLMGEIIIVYLLEYVNEFVKSCFIFESTGELNTSDKHFPIEVLDRRDVFNENLSGTRWVGAYQVMILLSQVVAVVKRIFRFLQPFLYILCISWPHFPDFQMCLFCRYRCYLRSFGNSANSLLLEVEVKSVLYQF